MVKIPFLSYYVGNMMGRESYLLRFVKWSIAITVVSGLFTGLFLLAKYYDFKIEIVVGILSFIGAILGGSLTLIGVWLGFRNERRKLFLKELPVQLERLNYAIDLILENVYDDLRSKTTDPYNMKKTLIYIDDTLQVKYTKSHTNLIEHYPQVLSRILISTNLNVLHYFLQFEKNLRNTGKSIYNSMDEIDKYKKDNNITFDYDYNTGKIIPPKKESNQSCFSSKEEIDAIKRLVNKSTHEADRSYVREIKKVYEDLLFNLAEEREILIKHSRKINNVK